MNVTISFKHLEHTPAVDERIRMKGEHFEKYLEGETQLKWICWIEETVPRLHVIQVHICASRCNLIVTAQSENLYKCIDEAVEKMEKQLRKHKELWKSRLHDDHEIIILDPEQAWDEYPEIPWGEFKKTTYGDHTL
ncbi:MAG: ribosome-associated translation inhibitor RaiA [Bdellovibrio sp.]|nr:ribosome-associated translation inhibitor RaiA [Bdellovibrio sp.]